MNRGEGADPEELPIAAEVETGPRGVFRFRDLPEGPDSGALRFGVIVGTLALVPGVSRSGITMTAARWFGYERVEAARFSMLIGAPILAASGAYAVLELVTAEAGDGLATLTDGLIVAGLSFVSGYVSIAVLMELLKRMSFLPFVIYRIFLAIALILASPLALNWISA